MSVQPSPLERAYAMARSGHYRNTTEIKNALRRQGVDQTQVYGKVLFADLRRLCQISRKPGA